MKDKLKQHQLDKKVQGDKNARLNKKHRVDESAGGEFLDDGVDRVKPIETKNSVQNYKYKFQKNGYTYEAEVTIGSDGAKDIAHFVTKDGTKQSIGYSTISESGELSNAFEVPDALQGQDLSKAMYERLGQEGFSTVNSSYNSSSLPVNYNEFMKVYDPSLNNAVDAVMSTPAAKALGSGWTPTKITVTPGKSVTVLWVKK